jgi:hypothetical protein
MMLELAASALAKAISGKRKQSRTEMFLRITYSF